MHQDASSLNSSFIDASINQSIEFIANTLRQFFQLIFCLITLLVVGRIINFFVSKAQREENAETKAVDEEVKVESEPEVDKDQEKKPEVELTGWDSEPLQNDFAAKKSVEIRPSNVMAKSMKRQLKRKCISVGPVMLTPNSQIIRSLDADEREERYRYDILPVDSTDVADNVCVPFVTLQSLS